MMLLVTCFIMILRRMLLTTLMLLLSVRMIQCWVVPVESCSRWEKKVWTWPLNNDYVSWDWLVLLIPWILHQIQYYLHYYYSYLWFLNWLQYVGHSHLWSSNIWDHWMLSCTRRMENCHWHTLHLKFSLDHVYLLYLLG